MTLSRRANRMIIVLLGIGLVIPIAVPGEAAITVKGDVAAWKEIDAALTRLRALPGWRVRENQRGGSVTREIEFAPPNYHVTRRTPTGTFEVFHVGDVTVTRSSTKSRPDAKCRRISGAGRSLPPQDLKDYMTSGAAGELTIGRKPDTSIAGIPVHAYTYLLKQGAGVMVGGDIFTGTRMGLPVRATAGTPGRPVITRDYDYGGKIAFTLPC